MTLIKRSSKGSALSYDEMDGNFEYLRSRPGAIIETLAGNCKGETITVESGTYTLENVTDIQGGTTTYTAVTGSTINYTPPAGTTKVIYSFNYKFDVTENSGISHHVLHIDGVEVEPTTTTISSNYASTNWHHAGFMIPFSFVIDCNASSDNASEGQFTSWTSPKELKIMYREYNSSYESALHYNTWWGGSSASGTDRVRSPTLTIQAIA